MRTKLKKGWIVVISRPYENQEVEEGTRVWLKKNAAERQAQTIRDSEIVEVAVPKHYMEY